MTATAPKTPTAVKPSVNSHPDAPAPAADPADVARKALQLARTELAARMIERDDEIECVLTALVAGENVLFVGPPGCGKSLLADSVTEIVNGTRFSYLMTKFTDPAEVVGPISLAELKAGRYVRLTTGKLPEANVAFLDEIFKSSSAILNTLLKVLNERTFDDGTGVKDVPLQLCVAASNEWPTGESQQELGALFDRFTIRRTVKPIQTPSGKFRLRFDTSRKSAPLTARVTPAELDAARDAAAALPWSTAAVEAYEQIHRELAREGIIPGDRRDEKAVRVARAHAWLAGATEVEPDHLGVLADVLWDSPEGHPHKCAEVVSRVANPTTHQVNALLSETEQILAECDTKNLAQITGAATKLAEVHKKLRGIKGSSKADKAAGYVQARVKALKEAALEGM